MDTSFLIDWVRYEKRDLLFQYYELIFLSESVLNEIRTEVPLLWISKWMINNRIKVLQETAEIRNKALRVVEETRSLPIRSADYPEAVYLVFGKELSLDVLTENGGVFVAKEVIKDYQDVKVYRAIDVLYNLHLKGLLDNFEEEVRRYINVTKHTYTRDILERYGIKN